MRQAAITAEICEISAAANAIESADKKGAAGPGLGVMDNEAAPRGKIVGFHGEIHRDLIGIKRDS
jgi:hypothetical protein